uniref:Uncharacterized protein n=1 Tax=Ixodes ricinus TaxID=34613 RepID=A0A6B0U6U9_IXORI
MRSSASVICHIFVGCVTSLCAIVITFSLRLKCPSVTNVLLEQCLGGFCLDVCLIPNEMWNASIKCKSDIDSSRFFYVQFSLPLSETVSIFSGHIGV